MPFANSPGRCPTSRRAPRTARTSWKVRGKLVACQAINKSAEPNSLVVMIPFEQRDELIAAQPDVYYVTDHYVNYPCVLVRLSRVHRDALRDLLGMAARFVGETAKKKSAATEPTRLVGVQESSQFPRPDKHRWPNAGTAQRLQAISPVASPLTT